MFCMEETELRRIAQRADQQMADARACFVGAVRQAAAEGMSQRRIAAAVGRSQPEISRLLRFHGTTPHAMRLRSMRERLLDELKRHGISNVRVFGSVAEGGDDENSDIDLLVTASEPMGLIAQEKLRADVSHIVGIAVDLVFDHAIRPDLQERILAEAVPL